MVSKATQTDFAPTEMHGTLLCAFKSGYGLFPTT